MATASGLVPIASILVGDQVLAEDPKTGKVEPERVQAVIDDGIKPLMTVGLSDGSSLRVTTNHPFYVDSGPGIPAPGWVQAADLRAGDRLRTEGGRGVTVVVLRYHTGEAHVYTLTVARDHTYFVGTTGVPVLVHNCPKEHSSGARPSTEQKHQEGQRRQKIDKAGEKKDKSGRYKSTKKKKKS